MSARGEMVYFGHQVAAKLYAISKTNTCFFQLKVPSNKQHNSLQYSTLSKEPKTVY